MIELAIPLRRFTIKCSSCTRANGVTIYWYQLLVENVVIATGIWERVISTMNEIRRIAK